MSHDTNVIMHAVVMGKGKIVSVFDDDRTDASNSECVLALLLRTEEIRHILRQLERDR